MSVIYDAYLLVMPIITFGSVMVAIYYSHRATHFKEIDELKEELEDINNMKQDIATIKTDIQWIKQILQDGHK